MLCIILSIHKDYIFKLYIIIYLNCILIVIYKRQIFKNKLYFATWQRNDVLKAPHTHTYFLLRELVKIHLTLTGA